jgi:hypothetical protein
MNNKRKMKKNINELFQTQKKKKKGYLRGTSGIFQ